MNGIVIIDKQKGVTSRDIVNEAVKKLGIKKIGHTGTLDPLATGVLVLCVGNNTKLVPIFTHLDKCYIASIMLGTLTDTLDITGNILKEEKVNIPKEKIIDVISSFKGSYMQEVPIYSAVKIKGKKLYEYARSNEYVDLPKRKVEIKSISIVGDIEYIDNKIRFNINCEVSSGTYIRALIKDIAVKLNTIGIMTDLRRTRVGNFKLEDSINISELDNTKLINCINYLDYKKVNINDSISKKVLNGAIIDNKYNEDVLFIKDGEAIAIYKQYLKDSSKMKPYIMIKGGIL